MSTTRKIMVAVGVTGAVIGLGYGIRRLVQAKTPCTAGATKCVGNDLYTCNGQGQWELTESNSDQCTTALSCNVDNDCPQGFRCVNGLCVPG
jgi:hypothetical protein